MPGPPATEQRDTNKLSRSHRQGETQLRSEPNGVFFWGGRELLLTPSSGLLFSPSVPWPGFACLAVGETVILMKPPFLSVLKRPINVVGAQQNDSLADGYACHMTAALSPALIIVASHSGSGSPGLGNIGLNVWPPFASRTLARQSHLPGPWRILFRLLTKIPPSGVCGTCSTVSQVVRLDC